MTTRLQPVVQLVENSQCDAGDVVTGWVVQSDEVRNILTTDRDTAYTLLKERIDQMKTVTSAEENFRRRDKATEWGYNVALDDILTLLDHIYGKTDALTK